MATTVQAPPQGATADTIRLWLQDWWTNWFTVGTTGFDQYAPAFDNGILTLPDDVLIQHLDMGHATAGGVTGDELNEYLNDSVITLLADHQVLEPSWTAEMIRNARASTTTGGGGPSGLPSATPGTSTAIGMWLNSRGFIYNINEGDDTLPVVLAVTDEAQNKLMSAALAVLQRGGGVVPPGGMTWPDVIPLLEQMPSHQLDHVLEVAFPSIQTPWVMVEAPTGGMVGAPKTNVDVIRQQIPALSTADLHGALFASAATGVDWEPILLVAEALDKIGPHPMAGPTSTTDPTTGAVTWSSPPAMTPANFDDIARLLQEGLAEYDGDMTFAILHAVDPALASNVRRQPLNLSVEDVDRAQAVLKDYKMYSSQQGTPLAPSSLGVVFQLAPAGEVAETRDVKPDAMRESFRNLYKLWFLKDPTDKELDAFSDHFDGELDAYQRTRLGARKNPFDAEGDSIQAWGGAPANIRTAGKEATLPGFAETQPDVGVTARSYLRADDMYKSLFGNKPGGMTEEDYVQTFATQATQSLGAAPGSLAAGSIQAGMKTGDPRSVARHALMTGGVDRSGTLSEKMARSGEIFRSLT